MRFFLLALVLGSLSPAFGLGRLVAPDGSSHPIGENPASDGVTLTFPDHGIVETSWLILPRGTQLLRAELASLGFRQTRSVPTVRSPALRYAIEVPAHLLSMNLRGRVAAAPTILRTRERPHSIGETWVYLSSTELSLSLPRWRVASPLLGALELSRPVDSPWKVTFSGEGKSQTVSFPASVLSWTFYPEVWGFQPSEIRVSGKDFRLAGAKIKTFKPDDALVADPLSLLAWSATQWRESRREWFAWAGTSVLVLISRDYQVQDDYLKRLAFYVEKTGFRGRLASDEEMTGLHGWNAHDYAATDLARFFTQAAAEAFPLNSSELELRERLLSAGILVSQGKESWTEGKGALVGISAQSPPVLREVLFVHEGFHGLYFTGPSFRSGVKAIWTALSPGAQQAFRDYLALSSYDPTDEALMINEFQAYVLQRPARDWPNFFKERVLAKYTDRGKALSWMAEYLGAANALDELVNALYGLESGKVSQTSSP